MKAATFFAAMAALLSSVGSAAFAQDAPSKIPPCAPVYGTWRTAYVMDQYGNPQPIEQPQGWPGLLMEARIDKDKAVLIWFGGKKKKTFQRWYRYKQDEFNFSGLRKSQYVGASTSYDTVIEYPHDKCYLDLWHSLQEGDVGSLDHHVLMEKIK